MGFKGKARRVIADTLPGFADIWRSYRHARSFRGAQMQQTQWGFRLAGSPLMAEGSFEPAETKFIREALADCAALVDVGANIGFYSCLARSMGKRVVAVEPHPDNLQFLLLNLAANGWDDAEVFPVGLADKPGIAALFGASTGASLVENWAGISKAWQRRIAISTLDSILCGKFEGERILLKVDVEGAEHGVLKGATETLSREPRPIWLVEVCFSEHFPGGVNPNYQAVFDLFWSHGYSATAVSTGEPVSRADVSRWLANGVRDGEETNFVWR